jgi:hypothetical protein
VKGSPDENLELTKIFAEFSLKEAATEEVGEREMKLQEAHTKELNHFLKLNDNVLQHFQ